MKKTILQLIFIFTLLGANAQKVWIQDTAIRHLYKNIAAGAYADNYTPCPTCFDAQDSLNKVSFLNYTSNWLNVKSLAIIDLSNSNLTSLNELQYYGWGKDMSQPLTVDIGTIGINCAHNSLTSVDYSIIPKDLAYYNFSYNNISTGVSLCLQYNINFNSCYTHCFSYGIPFELNFSNNNIETIPAIGNNLYPNNHPIINLSHNKLQSIDYSNATTLGRLDLSYNRFKSFFQDLPPIDGFYKPTRRGLINLSHNDSLTDLFIRGVTNFSSIDNTDFFDIDASYCSINNAAFSWEANNSTHYASTFNINLSHNKLTKLPGFSDNIISPYWGLSVDTLDISYNNIQNANFAERFSINSSLGYGSYLWNKVSFKKVDLSHNNMTDIIGDFPENLFTTAHLTANPFAMDFSNNNLQCFPKIPSWISNLSFDTAKITCLPNVGTYNINNTNSSVYPSCNPTNNVHHCQSFPTVTGKIYLDINNNNIKDTADEWMSNFEVILKTSSGKIIRSYTNDSGAYSISGDVLGVYTIYFRAPQWHSINYDSIVGNFTQFDSTYVQDIIRLQLTTVFDSLVVSKSISSAARVNRDLYLDFYLQNRGSTKLNPTITINYDTSKVMYAFNSCGAVNSNSGEVTKTYNNFKAGNSADCFSGFLPKSSLQIGDMLYFVVTTTYASVTTIDTLYTTVTGSFDPNDKYATPYFTTTQVANGDYIDYTVHFQNTGNDTAFTVVIADTLSNLLQANSFQLMGSSHNCKTTINGNKVYFEFINIQLPDSNINQLGSNGFVRFRVKPVSNVTVGTIIPNTASIYFDYNKPVITNVANTKIVIPAVITPLTIISYQLRLTNDKSVSNEWQTANELNVSYYNIERSVNGKDFITIGKVKANNKSNNEYSFVDELKTNTQYPNTIYYRIVGVDYDVRKTYSSVKSISTNSKPNTVNIFPNPAKNVIYIESKEAIKEIRVIDYLGKEVASFYAMTSNTNKLIINTHQFAKGLYVVQVTTLNTKVFNEKLLIE